MNFHPYIQRDLNSLKTENTYKPKDMKEKG